MKNPNRIPMKNRKMNILKYYKKKKRRRKRNKNQISVLKLFSHEKINKERQQR